MKKPLFSVIIPVFNAERTIQRSIDSIIGQSLRDIEILVKDGGSTDRTLEIISRSYPQEPGIRIISSPDSGIYDAMNQGMEAASGDWLCFLGADDELYSRSTLAEVSDRLRPEMQVVYGNARIVGKGAWAGDGSIYDGVFDLKKLLQKNICHQAIFYKKEFVKKAIGSFNLRYRLYADWDFNLRCRAKTEFHYLDIIISNFYAGGESTRTVRDDEFTADFLTNVLRYFRMSVFDPAINHDKFPFYEELLAKQKQKNYLRYTASRIRRALKRTFQK